MEIKQLKLRLKELQKKEEDFKERKRELAREWYKKNRQKKLKQMKKYWATHPKQLKKNIQRTAIWRKEHREEYNEYQRNVMRKRLNVKNPRKYFRKKNV